jgi:hypothetical protein
MNKTEEQKYNILYVHFKDVLSMDEYPEVASLSGNHYKIKLRAELMLKQLEIVDLTKDFTGLKSLYMFYMDTLFNEQEEYKAMLVEEYKE